MIEEFYFGCKNENGRMKRFNDGVSKRMKKYDLLYETDSRSKVKAIRDRAYAIGIDYGARYGSGAKSEIGFEHDTIMLIQMITLKEDFAFGDKRLKRFFDGVETKIRYYNRVFEGNPKYVLDVTINRLMQYGFTANLKDICA